MYLPTSWELGPIQAPSTAWCPCPFPGRVAADLPGRQSSGISTKKCPFSKHGYFCCAEVSNFRTGNENLPSRVIWSQCGLTMPSFRALRMNQDCFRTKEKNCHYCQKCWEGYTGAKAIVPLTSMATQSNCGSQNCSFISPECVQAVAPAQAEVEGLWQMATLSLSLFFSGDYYIIVFVFFLVTFSDYMICQCFWIL